MITPGRAATSAVGTEPATFEPALRHHLDAHGFRAVKIDNAGIGMAASRTNPDDPWVRSGVRSMERSLGTRMQVIPNASGGQHGPDEHFLPDIGREGIVALAGIWWDLGEGGVP